MQNIYKQFKNLSNIKYLNKQNQIFQNKYQNIKYNTIQQFQNSNRYKFQLNYKWLGIVGFMSIIKYKIDQQNKCTCASPNYENTKQYFDAKLNWHFKKMSNQNYQNVILISGTSNKKLSQDIANFLGIPLTPLTIKQYDDGEFDIECDDEDNLRGKHIFIIQSTCSPVNDNMVEVALLSGWLKRQSVKQITLVMPYYGYSRHKKGRRLSADASQLYQTMAIDRFITLDIHAGQILGYYKPEIMFENLEASIVPLNYFLNLYEEKREDFVIISPDADGVGRARQFCDLFNQKGGANCKMGIILRYAQRTDSEDQEFQLIGDVKGKNVIIIDDLIDTATTLRATVDELKAQGAKKVYAYATHTLFTGQAFKNIQESAVDKIITTDTIPAQKEEQNCDKVIRLTIAPLLAEAVRRIEHRISLESLTGITYDQKHQHKYGQQKNNKKTNKA